MADRPIARTNISTKPADALGGLGDILGFHIRLAHGAVYRHFSDTFADLGLTQKQVSVLWLASDHPGIAQSDIARRLQMDRATTMAIVDRLEGRGLLDRGPSPHDGRKQTLSVTADGAATLVRAKQAIAAHEQWLKARFTPREIDRLIELLTRIHQ